MDMMDMDPVQVQTPEPPSTPCKSDFNKSANGDVKNGLTTSEKKHKDKHHKEKKHKHKHSKDKEHSRERSSSSSIKHKSDKRDRDRLSSSPSKGKEEVTSSSSLHRSKHKEDSRTNERRADTSPQRIKAEVKSESRSPTRIYIKMEKNEEYSDENASPFNTPIKKYKIKKEESSDSEDETPLSQRQRRSIPNGTNKRKRELEDSDDEDDIPLSQRKDVKKLKTEVKLRRRVRRRSDDDGSDYGSGDSFQYVKEKKPKVTSKSSPSSSGSSPVKKGGRKAKEEPEEVWEWWKEERRDDGSKWTFLEHKGPLFAPEYEPLPKEIKFRYNGKSVKLSEKAEEVAGFYARFIEHDYTTKPIFNENFFKDWRKVMSVDERNLIRDLKGCDFQQINEYYKKKSEDRKAMSKEEKAVIKKENEEIIKKYGVCILDGHNEKIGNFRIEPPGLFRGRGEHPKMGMLKTRVQPEDVIINCSKDSKFPPPPKGHQWKEVRHDNTVSWLCSWVENVQGQPKYVMLNPTSRLKGEKDWLKYEKARELANKIDEIRENYKNDFKSKEMKIRQRAVALYFIDKLALRAGNEKDEDQADTVGCCSLRVEHIKLHDTRDDKECVVEFDFLGKDSIRYHNEVAIEKRVFKNLKLFLKNKKKGDDLFDRLNTGILNKHLSELMDGLSAKVFRTYNASHTLQEQLDLTTPKNGTMAEKLLAYNRANRAVAILCNHQRAPPKSHEKSMENLENKISQKREAVRDAKSELKKSKKGSAEYEKKQNAFKRLDEQLRKLEMDRTDKEEGKEIALGTSKLNYLDPRITVSWCKKHEVPIEKAYNKTQRAKFRWAIDMADKKFKFD